MAALFLFECQRLSIWFLGNTVCWEQDAVIIVGLENLYILSCCVLSVLKIRTHSHLSLSPWTDNWQAEELWSCSCQGFPSSPTAGPLPSWTRYKHSTSLWFVTLRLVQVMIITTAPHAVQEVIKAKNFSGVFLFFLFLTKGSVPSSRTPLWLPMTMILTLLI